MTVTSRLTKNQARFMAQVAEYGPLMCGRNADDWRTADSLVKRGLLVRAHVSGSSYVFSLPESTK